MQLSAPLSNLSLEILKFSLLEIFAFIPCQVSNRVAAHYVSRVLPLRKKYCLHLQSNFERADDVCVVRTHLHTRADAVMYSSQYEEKVEVPCAKQTV